MHCLQFARCSAHCGSLVFQLCGKHYWRTNMLRPTFEHNGDSHTTSAAHIRSINVLRNYFYLHTYWLHLLSEFWTQSSSVNSQLTCRSKLLSIHNRCPTDCELVPVVFFSCPDLCRRRSRVSPKSYLVGKYMQHSYKRTWSNAVSLLRYFFISSCTLTPKIVKKFLVNIWGGKNNGRRLEEFEKLFHNGSSHNIIL